MSFGEAQDDVVAVGEVDGEALEGVGGGSPATLSEVVDVLEGKPGDPRDVSGTPKLDDEVGKGHVRFFTMKPSGSQRGLDGEGRIGQGGDSPGCEAGVSENLNGSGKSDTSDTS